MAARLLLLCIISAFLFVGVVRADDLKLPSRKASVVMPLLNKISPKDSAESVLERVRKILGEADMGDAGGPRNRFWEADYYWLDDKTEIIVGSTNGKFDGISICLPGQTWKDFYRPPKP